MIAQLYRCAPLSCHGRRDDPRGVAWRRSTPRCRGSRYWTAQTRSERFAPPVLPLPALSVSVRSLRTDEPSGGPDNSSIHASSRSPSRLITSTEVQNEIRGGRFLI